ncbi:hypothetical protein AWT69_004907 [Pseudomonas putida]|nr:hypothetical protein AWT69_004907 [Pseudomonas putida]
MTEGLEVDQGTGGTHGGSLLAVLVIDKAPTRQMGVGTHRAGVRERVNRFSALSRDKPAPTSLYGVRGSRLAPR